MVALSKNYGFDPAPTHTVMPSVPAGSSSIDAWKRRASRTTWLEFEATVRRRSSSFGWYDQDVLDDESSRMSVNGKLAPVLQRVFDWLDLYEWQNAHDHSSGVESSLGSSLGITGSIPEDAACGTGYTSPSMASSLNENSCGVSGEVISEVKSKADFQLTVREDIWTCCGLYGFRVVREKGIFNLNRDHAEFQVIFCTEQQLYVCWRRYRDFKRLASAVRHLCLPDTMDIWSRLEKTEKLVPQLNAEYLRSRAFLLDEFFAQLLQETPDIDPIVDFMEESGQ